MMPHDPHIASADGNDGDERIQALLSSLDPETSRQGYWRRFQRDVVDAARFELSRRRRIADLTIAETVTSWARAVVPSALVAAAAAAVVLLSVPTPPQVVEVELGVEEILSAGLDGDAIPADPEDRSEPVSFAAAEIF